MNKRIKKKWSRVERLETKAAQLMAENILLSQSLKARIKAHEELEERINVNTLATNLRFDQLEAESKALWQEIEDLKHQLKPKRSFFNRK